MTNTKPEHDEDDLKTETETDRIAREGDEKGLSEFDRRFSHLNISSDDPRRTWYSYGYGDATLELTHARSRPKLYIKKNGAHTRALGFVCKQCEAETDVTDLQIEFVEASSRPEPAGEFDEKAAIEQACKGIYADSAFDWEIFPAGTATNDRIAFVKGARWQHSQLRAQTSDADAHLTLHKMADTKIRELESELAELKAPVELNEIEKTLVYALSDETRQLEFHNPEFVYIRGLLSIIKRITSSRGNE